MSFTTAMTKHVPFSSRLLRDAGYINGVWTAGGATKPSAVIQPAAGAFWKACGNSPNAA